MTDLASIELADAADSKQLEIAASGLSPTMVAVALRVVGADTGRGLAGVPKSKVRAACAILRVSFRTDTREPLDPRTAFERASELRVGAR